MQITVGHASRRGRIVWNVPMTICPTCAAGRADMLRWFAWYFVILVTGGILFVSVAKVLKLL